MLDCISGGRLVAGLPLGSPMDVNLAYGITPMEHRERYREAFELVLKAWQAKEIFAWNGKYFQLGQVNLWPRPIQEPHPPVWVPGSGSISTFDFAAEQQRLLLLPQLRGRARGQDHDGRLLARGGQEGARAQSVPRGLPAAGGGGRDRRAGGGRRTRGTSSTSITSACTCPPQWFAPPGNQDYRSLLGAPTATRCGAPRIPRRSATRTSWTRATSSRAARPPCASASMEEVIKRLHVGNLMVLIQIGSMPHELTLKNIDLFAREVLPGLRDIWDDEGWENHWWPERLRGAASRAARAARWRAARGTRRAADVARLAGARAACACTSKGAGPALVFFHGPWGLTWGPFLDALAQQLHVYAPEHPGTTPGEPDDDPAPRHPVGPRPLLRRAAGGAGARRASTLVGHSFGAMVACEVAALPSGARAPPRAHRSRSGSGATRRPSSTGCCWSRPRCAAHVFHDPTAPPRSACSRCPTIPRTGALARTRLTWAMGSTGKFIWPIPDKGLKKRIHRVSAPTLLVWGEDDRLVPRAYAKEFAGRLPDARHRGGAGGRPRAAPRAAGGDRARGGRLSSRLEGLPPGANRSTSSFRFARSSSGNARSSPASVSTMAAATTRRVNHLWSAGTTYHGACSVRGVARSSPRRRPCSRPSARAPARRASENFQFFSGSSSRARKRLLCSSFETCRKNLRTTMPLRVR